jgi:hypothetical protein
VQRAPWLAWKPRGPSSVELSSKDREKCCDLQALVVENVGETLQKLWLWY